MNTIFLYIKTFFAFITLILSLSLIQDNYTAFADETSKCEQARALLAKLQSREKGFTDAKEDRLIDRDIAERQVTITEQKVLDCQINRPQTDFDKKGCFIREERLKHFTKSLGIVNKEIKWTENQLEENRSKQEKLRASMKSNNCNGDTEEEQESVVEEITEEVPDDWVKYGVKRNYNIVWQGKTTEGGLKRLSWIAHDKNNGVVTMIFSGKFMGKWAPITLNAHKEFGRYVARDQNGLANRFRQYLKQYPDDAKYIKPSRFLNNILFIEPVGKFLKIEWKMQNQGPVTGIGYPEELGTEQ